GPPADIISAFQPLDGAGQPLSIRYPDPSGGLFFGPVTEMIRGPGAGVAAFPGPAVIGVEPAPFAEGSPLGGGAGGTEGVAFFPDGFPLALGFEGVNDQVEVDQRALNAADGEEKHQGKSFKKHRSRLTKEWCDPS